MQIVYHKLQKNQQKVQKKTDFSEEITTLSDLRKDNERLRKQIVRLKGEMKVTKKPTVRRDDVEKPSRRLIRECHVMLFPEEVTKHYFLDIFTATAYNETKIKP